MPVTKAAPAFALVALLFAGIVASHWDFVPYWDAKGYFDCIAHATQTAFSLQNYRCFGHTTIAYLLPLAFTQSLAPWNLPLTYAANALLGLASIAAFQALLGRLFPGRSAVEYALVTALYALAPLFVVHAIFLNLDYGMTAYFVLFLHFLIARRVWPASVFAIALVLSKETGAAVFAAAIAAYAIAFVIRGQVWREAPLRELRAHAPLLAVPLALAAYMVASHLTQPDIASGGSWMSSYAVVSMLHDPLSALSINPADAGIRSLLADLFVLNYQWIYTVVLVAAVCATVARTDAAGRARAAGAAGNVLFLSLLLVGLVYVVTRYRDYNNARYVLVALPVLVALFYRALLIDGDKRPRAPAGARRRGCARAAVELQDDRSGFEGGVRDVPVRIARTARHAVAAPGTAARCDRLQPRIVPVRSSFSKT